MKQSWILALVVILVLSISGCRHHGSWEWAVSHSLTSANQTDHFVMFHGESLDTVQQAAEQWIANNPSYKIKGFSTSATRYANDFTLWYEK